MFSGRKCGKNSVEAQPGSRGQRFAAVLSTILLLLVLSVFTHHQPHYIHTIRLPALTSVDDLSAPKTQQPAVAHGALTESASPEPSVELPLRNVEPGREIAEAVMQKPPDITSHDQLKSTDPLIERTPEDSESTEMALRGVPTSSAPRKNFLADLRTKTYQKAPVKMPGSALAGQGNGLKKMRFAIVQAGTILGGLAVFKKFQNTYGGVAQPFRIGNDWTKDNAAGFDELLHFQGSYRLARGITEFYKWSGVNSETAEFVGAGMTLSAMTLLEYLDGRRANDYASSSDLIANFLGVAFAYLKPRVPFLQKTDFRVSYQNFADPFTTEKLIDYGRITQWLMFDLSAKIGAPVEVGIGYSVKNAFTPKVQPELYVGIGFSFGNLFEVGGHNTTNPLQMLDVFQLGIRKKLN